MPCHNVTSFRVSGLSDLSGLLWRVMQAHFYCIGIDVSCIIFPTNGRKESRKGYIAAPKVDWSYNLGCTFPFRYLFVGWLFVLLIDDPLIV